MQNNQTMAGGLSLPGVPGCIQEKSGKYKAREPLSDTQIIKAAQAILKRKFHKRITFTNPDAAGQYLTMKYSTHQLEVFLCMFLDNQHQLIKLEEMFKGQ